MPAIQLLIPDDYQRIGPQLAELQQDPAYACRSLGDRSRAPGADEALAQAEALLLIRERAVVDEALLARHIDVAACRRAGLAVHMLNQEALI
jgi:D-3-phosphoglycerate dehydrogenase